MKMEGREIVNLLNHRGKGSAALLDKLKRDLDEHPYFTSIRLLYLKALQESEQLGFELELKRTAAHIPNRELLFEWVSKPFARPLESHNPNETESLKNEPVEAAPPKVLQKEVQSERESSSPANEDGQEAVQEEPIKESSKPAEYKRPEVPSYIEDPAAAARRRVQQILEGSRKNKTPNEADKVEDEKVKIDPERTEEPPQKKSETVEISSPEPEKEVVRNSEAQENSKEKDDNEKTVISSTEPSHPKEQAEQSESPLTTKKALEETLSAPHTAEAETQTTASEKQSFGAWLQQLQAEKKQDQKTNKQEAIVERFLKDPPSFRPSKNKMDSRNIAKESLREDPEIMTETLARLYTEQEHFKKAIQAYEILSLRFPEKSSFFAGRIRELRKRLKEKR